MGGQLQGIYAISDEILTPYDILPQMLETALKAGVSIFQLRDKHTSDNELESIAKPLMALCERYNALFVLNDRVELAIKLQAKALHIGENDGDIASIRARFKGILGVSCYDSIKKAKVAKAMGADYVAFGAMFASKTKPNAKIAPLELLDKAKALDIPICAIGGINADNIALLHNAQMCAIISAIWDSPSPDLSTRLESIAKNVSALKAKHYQG